MSTSSPIDFRQAPSAVPEATLAAYLRAAYIVGGPVAEVRFAIGEPSAALDRALAAVGADGGVLLTAWNPHGQRPGLAANESAQARLMDLLARRGIATLPGHGEDPAGDWEREPSVLALDLGEPDADAIGARFGQNAYVLCRAGAAPRLVVLR